MRNLICWIGLIHINVHPCRRTCRIMFQSLQFKTIVIIIAGNYRLHVLLHILRISRFRYSTIAIALWYISLTYFKTTVVPQPHRHVSKRSQFPIPKNHMFCVIVQDTSSLLLSTCSTEENAMTEILLTVT